MRILCALAFAMATLLGTGLCHAETRVFVIANNDDGYGVDRCLATGAQCGAVVASAYCRSQDFDQARSFHKVGPGEVAGRASTGTTACLGDCEAFVAIECTR